MIITLINANQATLLMKYETIILKNKKTLKNIIYTLKGRKEFDCYKFFVRKRIKK